MTLQSYKTLLQEIISARENATQGEWTAFENGAWGGKGFGVSTGAKDPRMWFTNDPTDNSNESSLNALFIAIAANHTAKIASDMLVLIEALEEISKRRNPLLSQKKDDLVDLANKRRSLASEALSRLGERMGGK